MPPSTASSPPAFKSALPWLLLIGGSIGFLAAFVLTVEKMALLANPLYVPSCSINPVLSCGSVMTKPQAQVFGFANSLLGIAGFAAVLTIGAALLAGAQFRRWFWLGLQAGVVFGVVFVTWLMFQSLYSIGALCPYCMLVWAVTIPIFWYVTLYNLSVTSLPPSARAIANGAIRYHTVVLAIWFVIILVLIASRFWSFWTTLL
jgi:uncharacterized membrane protein